MATLGMIVSRMRAAGESQEAIDAVRREYEKVNPPKSDFKPAALTEAQDFLQSPRSQLPTGKIESSDPGTFWGGVRQSLTPGGGAWEAAGRGLKGFAKGATLDIPHTLVEGAKGLAVGTGSLMQNPIEHFKAAPQAFKEMGQGIVDVFSQAGSDEGSEEFGRMVGQFTGQPAVLEPLTAAGIARLPQARMQGAKLVEGTGKLLSKAQPTGAPGNLPITPRMIGLRTASRGAGALGRKLQAAGEKMRINAATATPTKGVPLKGATPGELTSEDLTKFAGGGQGITRPRPIRFDTRDVSRDPTAFTRPIVETTDELAARRTEPIDLERPVGPSSRTTDLPYEPNAVQPAFGGAPGEFVAPGELQPIGVAEPGGFSSRYQDIPFDTSTGPQMPSSPAAGGRLTGNRVPTIEERMATIIEELRQADAQAPGVELPPPPYSQGARVPPEQPRVDVKTARTPKGTGEESPYAHLSLEQLEQILAERKAGGPGNIPPPPSAAPAPASASKFEPSVDPARIAFTPEELELIRSVNPEDIEAALRIMSGEEAPIRTAAGEIVDTTTGEIITPPAPPSQAGTPRFGGGKTRRESLFSRTKRKLGSEETGAVGKNIDPIIEEQAAAKRARNPLTPEVPEGQLTNRQILDLSNQRAAENRLAAEAQRFAGEVSPGGHEFSEDMLFTPEELRNPDIPEMVSPVENPFDPRVAPGGVVSEPDILAGAKPTFGKNAPGPRQRLLNAVERLEAARIERKQAGRAATPEELAYGKAIEEEAAADGSVKIMVDEPDVSGGPAMLSDLERGTLTQQLDTTTPAGYESARQRVRVLAAKHRSGGLTPMESLEFKDLQDKFIKNGLLPPKATGADIFPEAYGAPEPALPPTAEESAFLESVRPEAPEVPIKRSLFGDERGAVGPDINKTNPTKTVAQNAKKYQVTDPNGKRIGDITVDDAQVKQMKTFEKFKDIPDERIAAVIYKTKLKRILDETGLGEGSVTVTPISVSAKRAEAIKPAAPKEEPTITSRLTKGGETVAEKKTVPEPEEKLSEPPESKPEKAKGGRPKSEDMPPIPESFAGTPAPSMKAESAKGYSASTTIETGKKTRTKVSKEDVDSAFSQSGNTYSVRKAAGELEEANAPDVEYKNLMPESFQFALAEGETFKDRLARMLDAHREGRAERARQAQPAPEPVAAKPVEDKAARQERIDKFVAEVTGETPELRAKRLNKPAEPPPSMAEKRRIPKLRGPIPQGVKATLKKVTPQAVERLENEGFVNSGRFTEEGYPIYVKKSSKFSDKANKAAQDFGKKN